MFNADYLVYLFLIAGVCLSIWMRKLTATGALTGGAVGFLVFYGGDIGCLLMLVLFFAAGTAATKLGKHQKETIGAAEARNGRRTAGQVLANGGVAALMATAMLVWPAQSHLFRLMLAGSLAAAIADTLSSELGMVYGRQFFNVLSFKADERGLDGVVSLEGTLIGVAGAGLIAAIYGLSYGWSLVCILIILAGFVGNLADSILGATLERGGVIGNNLVNFLNTLTGALICWLLY